MKMQQSNTSQEKSIYSLLTELEKVGCFELKLTNVERRKVVKEIIKAIKNNSIDSFCTEEDRFKNAVFERLISLKSYKLITIRNKDFRLTSRGNEFLKHEDKEYYLAKLLLMDKYKRTKHPDIFIKSLERYVLLSKEKRELLMDYRQESHEKFRRKLAEEIAKDLNLKDKIQHVSLVCTQSLRRIIVGTVGAEDIPVKTLKKILVEIKNSEMEAKGIKKQERKLDEKSFIVDNVLECHIEDIIRRNFKKLFPDLRIIDQGQHYRTINGNYIDILAKNKNNNALYIIELKRDRPPSSALAQLLDYMNQVSKEFKTKSVRGVLMCNRIDSRTKSALRIINQPKEKIDVRRFDINMRIR